MAIDWLPGGAASPPPNAPWLHGRSDGCVIPALALSLADADACEVPDPVDTGGAVPPPSPASAPVTRPAIKWLSPFAGGSVISTHGKGKNPPCGKPATNNSSRPCPTRTPWCAGTPRNCWPPVAARRYFPLGGGHCSQAPRRPAGPPRKPWRPGDAAARPVRAAALSDTGEETRSEAARSLGRLGPAGTHAVPGRRMRGREGRRGLGLRRDWRRQRQSGAAAAAGR